MIGAAVANHLLAREGWARERLAQHAGQTFAIAVGPFGTALAIDATGMLFAPRTDAVAADVTLRLSPLDVPSLLADPSRWSALVDVRGDAALAASLAELAQTVPWFIERALASLLGPIAGQRAADAGRALLRAPAYAASRFADALASYASDEVRIATRGIELATFAEQVAALASRTDALAMRVDALAASASTGLAERRIEGAHETVEIGLGQSVDARRGGPAAALRERPA
jgi:ubiquinone biosynthesis protein UbiJ